jgi:phosphoglycolate phosphatase
VSRLVVGFDLDMTLVDSRPGIAATYRALVEETGTFVDVDLAVSRLGPPLEVELAHWFPPDEVPTAADRYRALYPDLAIPRVALLPGARESVQAVLDAGGSALVVTGKNERNARLHLQHLGVDLDVVGDVWRHGKADVFRERGVTAYVGDHVHDMDACRAAGVVGIAVPTGPCSAEELRDAGADHVVDDLHGVVPLVASLTR